MTDNTKLLEVQNGTARDQIELPRAYSPLNNQKSPEYKPHELLDLHRTRRGGQSNSIDRR
jgi:hypothetical protein